MILSAKFRVKDGVPYSIEKPTGTQFRCGACGEVFYHRKELDKHMKIEKKNIPIKEIKFPGINQRITVNLYYYQNTKEETIVNFSKFKEKFLKQF
jgi:hypothetical protein